ncbi:unnamed protein product [Echinostoma caproni]|uniref:IRS-type PTB domain-containing protein n=1 Tax=Echinostoma caproni TaxID=27848 RepID=A0A183B0D5_9TREM|nr:unnamed protein product [Echinostoma caproni]
MVSDGPTEETEEGEVDDASEPEDADSEPPSPTDGSKIAHNRSSRSAGGGTNLKNRIPTGSKTEGRNGLQCIAIQKVEPSSNPAYVVYDHKAGIPATATSATQKNWESLSSVEHIRGSGEAQCDSQRCIFVVLNVTVADFLVMHKDDRALVCNLFEMGTQADNYVTFEWLQPLCRLLSLQLNVFSDDDVPLPVQQIPLPSAPGPTTVTGSSGTVRPAAWPPTAPTLAPTGSQEEIEQASFTDCIFDSRPG